MTRIPNEWPERVLLAVMVAAAFGCVMWGISIAMGG